MILTELIVLMDDFLSYDLDNVKQREGHTVTNEEKTAQLNYGVRSVSRFIKQFDPSITMTPVADQNYVDLRDVDTPAVSRKVIEASFAVVNGTVLRRPDGSRGLYKYQEAERLFTDWRGADSGTPSGAWQIGDKLYFNCPVSSTVVSAAENYIGGKYLAADMVWGADVAPDIPEELHEAVAYCAAVFVAQPTVGESTAMNRTLAYRQEWQEAAKEVRRRNMRYLNDFGTTPGSAWSDFTYLG